MNAAILNNIIGQNMFLFRVERKDFMRLPYFTSHLVILPYGSKTSSMSLTLVDLLNLPIKSWPSARRDIFLFFLVKCPDEMIRCETARPGVNSYRLRITHVASSKYNVPCHIRNSLKIHYMEVFLIDINQSLKFNENC